MLNICLYIYIYIYTYSHTIYNMYTPIRRRAERAAELGFRPGSCQHLERVRLEDWERYIYIYIYIYMPYD